MTTQPTLPGMELQWPENTPVGQWMIKRGWKWEGQEWMRVVLNNEIRWMGHDEAESTYWAADEPPF